MSESCKTEDSFFEENRALNGDRWQKCELCGSNVSFTQSVPEYMFMCVCPSVFPKAGEMIEDLFSAGEIWPQN